jgi:hypothetical protein
LFLRRPGCITPALQAATRDMIHHLTFSAFQFIASASLKDPAEDEEQEDNQKKKKT